MKSRRKDILFLILLIFLFVPLIQQKTKVIPVQSLTGASDPPFVKPFSFTDWTAGTFQASVEANLEERIGFRPWLIRMKNQLQYSLFHQANASGVVVGKDRYLYEYYYIRAYNGGDYLGDAFWDEKFRRFEMVRDTLNKLGVEFGLVIEPGKASYYPEYIPDHYLKDEIRSTNYQQILTELAQTTIPYLDFNQLFLDQKENAEFPHFTRGGIHWAFGAMIDAVDTLLTFTQQLTSKQIPALTISPGEVSHNLRDTDNDLADILNLAFMPKTEAANYPLFSFEALPDSTKPRVLVIADSFYFNILYAKIPPKAFQDPEFWYYANDIFKGIEKLSTKAQDLDIQREVESRDVILIMVTERFYHKFDWSFIERLFHIYYPDELKNYIYDYTNLIISDYTWFDKAISDGQKRGLSPAEALQGNAEYFFWTEDEKGNIQKDMSYYAYKIRNDSAWCQQIKDKALKNGISFEKQLRLDAQWIIDNP